MKRKITISFICAIMCIFMSGCQKEETMETETKTIELNFTNDTEEAIDVWILPDIEANHKTSVWGKAMIDDLKVNGQASLKAVCQDEDRYLLRAIDADGLYYEANGITLKDAYRLKLILNRQDFSASLEVEDENGKTSTYEVFCAAL